jgi:hypothetical protein
MVRPPAFEHVVTTCLQKNPEERYQMAHDIKIELQWITLIAEAGLKPWLWLWLYAGKRRQQFKHLRMVLCARKTCVS